MASSPPFPSTPSACRCSYSSPPSTAGSGASVASASPAAWTVTVAERCLDLNTESIFGGLNQSSTLFRLKFLGQLNLANNNFNFTKIPSSLGILTNLRYLNLSNSGFSGQIPIGLSLLIRLVTLDLSTLYFPRVPTLQIENPNLITLLGNLSVVKELHLDRVNISANGEASDGRVAPQLWSKPIIVE
ncbi:hypothetical protein RHGRI_015541 [Rhododendron griersonianum]|uniref:Uncharacterized protein n=1 Tax=Rhododendron griersonianum TaxID=479676 RepID=A0AAV6KE71_9ERIC|nr:hypothetical protein RHGRI_015541 [Rhododendron griersonianum]